LKLVRELYRPSDRDLYVETFDAPSEGREMTREAEAGGKKQAAVPADSDRKEPAASAKRRTVRTRALQSANHVLRTQLPPWTGKRRAIQMNLPLTMLTTVHLPQ